MVRPVSQAQEVLKPSHNLLRDLLADVLKLEKKYGTIVYLVLDVELNQNLPPEDNKAEVIDVVDGKLYCTKFQYSVYKYGGKTRVLIDVRRFEDIKEACDEQTILELVKRAVRA